MSECNCCCAYLSPPWWVTMGYVPPVQSPGVKPSPQGVVIPPPPSGNLPVGPTRSQATPVDPARTQVTPTGTRPRPLQLVGDLARGDFVSAFTDFVQLL
jgi:hypothetical protein